MPYNIEPINKWNIGDVGENFVKYKLSQNKIDSIIIDRTYDLFLWQRSHRIEVKASHLSKRGFWNFNFKHWQTSKDAFDYAVCCCIDDDNNINQYYIIPQPYIRKMALENTRLDKVYKVAIKDNIEVFHLDGNSFDKYNPCRNLGFDIFLQDNKSAFTRKKNRLSKKLIEYPLKHRTKVLNEFIKVFDDKRIKYPVKELKEKFGCCYDFIRTCKRLIEKGGD